MQIAPQLIAPTLQRLRCACGAQEAFPRGSVAACEQRDHRPTLASCAHRPSLDGGEWTATYGGSGGGFRDTVSVPGSTCRPRDSETLVKGRATTLGAFRATITMGQTGPLNWARRAGPGGRGGGPHLKTLREKKEGS